MSVFLVIENEFDNFDNFDNYNLNLLLIKRIILRSRKQGSPHAHLMNSNTSQRIENSQDRQESGTYPLILVNDIRSCILHLETPNIC